MNGWLISTFMAAVIFLAAVTYIVYQNLKQENLGAPGADDSDPSTNSANPHDGAQSQ